MQSLQLAYYGLARAAPSIGTIAIATAFGLRFSTSDFATYSLSITIATLTSGIATTWLQSAIVRQSGAHSEVVASRALVLAVGAVSSVAAMILTFVANLFALESSVSSTYRFSVGGAVAAFGLSMHAVAFSYWQTTRQEHLIAINGLVRGLVPMVAFAFGSVLRISIDNLITLCIASHAVSIPWRTVFGQLVSSTSSSVRQWSYGRSLILWTILAYLIQSADRFVLAILISPEAAGKYALLSDTLGKGTNLLLTPYTVWIAPRLMSARNESGISAGRVLFLSSVRTSLLIAFGVQIGMLFAVVVSTTTRQFLGVDDLGLGFAIAAISSIWSLGLVTHKGLEMSDKVSLMPVCMLASSIIYFFGCLIMAPIAGVWGVVISSLVAASVYVATTSSLSIVALNRSVDR